MANRSGTTSVASGILTKNCSGRCAQTKDIRFFTRKKSNRDGFETHCIECRAHARRLQTYDLQPEDYLRMLFAQGNACPICHRTLDELEHGLVVDHDHRTGKVRMLLCRDDNLALGFLNDDTNRIRNTLEYLELFEEKA
jgi:recombination endonuclease VII